MRYNYVLPVFSQQVHCVIETTQGCLSSPVVLSLLINFQRSERLLYCRVCPWHLRVLIFGLVTHLMSGAIWNSEGSFRIQRQT